MECGSLEFLRGRPLDVFPGYGSKTLFFLTVPYGCTSTHKSSLFWAKTNLYDLDPTRDKRLVSGCEDR